MIKLDVNTDSAIILTAKLEKLSRSAFPSAVRNTLNDAAFGTKKLIPETAKNNFTIRQKTLFRKFSSVDKANGYDVNKMTASVGLSGNQNKLLDGLEKQEIGGSVKGRKLLPMDTARISGSYSKKIQSKYNFRKMPKAGRRRQKQKGSKFFFIEKGNTGTLFENIGKNKIKPIYHLRNSNISRIKAKPFIRNTALVVSKKIDDFYLKNAEYQFKKALK